MRRLIYVPMIHDPWAESANSYLSQYVKNNPSDPYVKKLGEFIESHWNEVLSDLSEEKVDKVYQEGFTEVHDDESYMSFLQSKDEWNFMAVQRLLNKGTFLTKTEDMNAFRKYDGTDLSILERDIGIATNIYNTLGKSQTGALFIGYMHDYDTYKELETEENPIKVEIVPGKINEISEVRDSIGKSIKKEFSL